MSINRACEGILKQMGFESSAPTFPVHSSSRLIISYFGSHWPNGSSDLETSYPTVRSQSRTPRKSQVKLFLLPGRLIDSIKQTSVRVTRFNFAAVIDLEEETETRHWWKDCTGFVSKPTSRTRLSTSFDSLLINLGSEESPFSAFRPKNERRTRVDTQIPT